MDPTNLKAVEVGVEDAVAVGDVGVDAQCDLAVVDRADVDHIVHVQRRSVHTCVGQTKHSAHSQ